MKRTLTVLLVCGVAALLTGCGTSEIPPAETGVPTTAANTTAASAVTETTVPTASAFVPSTETVDGAASETTATAATSETTVTTVTSATASTDGGATASTAATRPTGEPEIDFSEFM